MRRALLLPARQCCRNYLGHVTAEDLAEFSTIHRVVVSQDVCEKRARLIGDVHCVTDVARRTLERRIVSGVVYRERCSAENDGASRTAEADDVDRTAGFAGERCVEVARQRL